MTVLQKSTKYLNNSMQQTPSWEINSATDPYPEPAESMPPTAKLFLSDPF